MEAAGTGQSSRRGGPGGLSRAPRRWSEKRSSGSFVGRSIPLPGAPRGHLICGVIDKRGRGPAGPPSPLFPPPRSRPPLLLPPGSLPPSCQKRCQAASRSSGDLPALGGAVRARPRALAPGPRRAEAAQPPAPPRVADAAGASGGSSGRRARRVSSEYSGAPRRRGRLAGSALAPDFRGHSPRRRERAWADGAIRQGSRAGGRP